MNAINFLNEFRKLTFLFRRSSCVGVSLASAAMNIGGAITFMQSPTLGLLFLVAAQSVGYFAPLKRFIVINLAGSFIALIAAIALSSASITPSEFTAVGILMGVAAAFINALRATEETLDDALWRADIASEAAEIGIFKWDFDTDLVSSNAALRKIFGLPEAGRIFAADAFAMVFEEDEPALQAAINEAIAGEDTFTAVFRVRTGKGGQGPHGPPGFKWIEGRGDVVKDARTGRRSLTGVNIDITERKESEDYIERLLDGVAAALALTDEEGRILHLNSFAENIYNTPVDDSRKELFWRLPALIQHEHSIRALFNAQEDEISTFEFSLDGENRVRTYLLSVSRIDRANGTVNYIPYAVDITARKDAETQNELLVAELNHRIKNLFSVVNALITLSARHASSVEDFATSTISRLAALHDAHNLGAADLRNRGASLREVFERTLAPWRTKEPRIFIHGDDQFLDAGEATSWALIAHELTTNANKYGALAHRGEVHISMMGDETNWRFVWSERKCAVPITAPAVSGFGQTVIKRLSSAYLGAETDFRFEPDGLQVAISTRSRD